MLVGQHTKTPASPRRQAGERYYPVIIDKGTCEHCDIENPLTVAAPWSTKMPKLPRRAYRGRGRGWLGSPATRSSTVAPDWTAGLGLVEEVYPAPRVVEFGHQGFVPPLPIKLLRLG